MRGEPQEKTERNEVVSKYEFRVRKPQRRVRKDISQSKI